MNSKVKINLKFNLNGKDIEITAGPSDRLLDILRNNFQLTGVKEGCGEGECGACSVFRNGRLVNSCTVPAAAVDGDEIITIEGFSKTEEFRIISEAYAQCGAVQCGFCTPGFILATAALLRKNPVPDGEQIKEGLSGNLCRCTGYSMIIEAVKKASENGAHIWRK